MVRGGSAPRQVACYSSCPHELLPLQPSLARPAGGALELEMRFRSLVPGQRQARLHVVDAASGELVAAALVTASVQPPRVTRTFEVSCCGWVLQGSGGPGQMLRRRPHSQECRCGVPCTRGDCPSGSLHLQRPPSHREPDMHAAPPATARRLRRWSWPPA
jgi:hypothetical protein